MHSPQGSRLPLCGLRWLTVRQRLPSKPLRNFKSAIKTPPARSGTQRRTQGECAVGGPASACCSCRVPAVPSSPGLLPRRTRSSTHRAFYAASRRPAIPLERGGAARIAMR